MKIFRAGILTATVFLLVLQDGFAKTASDFKIRRTPEPLDVKTPIEAIKEKLIPVLQPGGVNLKVLVEVVLQVVDCLGINLGNLTIPGIGGLPFSVNSKTKLSPIDDFDFKGFIIPNNINETISEYCNSEDFREIHEFIWVEGEEDERQLNDLLIFLWRFGYPDIYDNLLQMYQFFDCPEDLQDSLPYPPDPVKVTRKRRSAARSTLREQLKSNEVAPLQAQCDYMQIITSLLSSGALKLLGLVQVLLDQVTSNPSLHFLLGKIQEPVKSPPFRQFRLLHPTRRLVLKLNDVLMGNENFRVILVVIKDLLGVDLSVFKHLAEMIINIIEGFLWSNWDPMPPYP